MWILIYRLGNLVCDDILQNILWNLWLHVCMCVYVYMSLCVHVIYAFYYIFRDTLSLYICNVRFHSSFSYLVGISIKLHDLLTVDYVILHIFLAFCSNSITKIFLRIMTKHRSIFRICMIRNHGDQVSIIHPWLLYT